MRPKLRPGRILQSRVTHIATTFLLAGVAEAEGFEPPVPLGTLAFKAQGNRVLECAPSCPPASSLLKREPNCATCGSRLLHGCYTAVAARQPVWQWSWTGPGRRGWTSGGTCSSA